VHVIGGANLIRQALAAGLVGELTIIAAPVTWAPENACSTDSANLPDSEHLGVRQPPFAPFAGYRVKK
jgi:dihydrofolate reductase